MIDKNKYDETLPIDFLEKQKENELFNKLMDKMENNSWYVQIVDMGSKPNEKIGQRHH